MQGDNACKRKLALEDNAHRNMMGGIATCRTRDQGAQPQRRPVSKSDRQLFAGEVAISLGWER